MKHVTKKYVLKDLCRCHTRALARQIFLGVTPTIDL